VQALQSPDLMGALQASLERARERDENAADAGGDGARKQAPAKKKSAAKKAAAKKTPAKPVAKAKTG
jgi:hypothetical protein